MPAAMNTRLIRFVKVVVDVLYGLLIFACVALVLYAVLLPLLLQQEGFVGTASIPVQIGSGEGPTFEIAFSGRTIDSIHQAFVEEAEGTLRLETRSTLLLVISNAAKLVAAIGLAYVCWLLRSILQAILDGEPFSIESSHRIRRLGFVVLILGFLVPSVENLAATEIMHRLPETVPALQAGPTFDAEIILLSLLILILAHVWGYGIELERDRALTV
jgi:hypothetical protein